MTRSDRSQQIFVFALYCAPFFVFVVGLAAWLRSRGHTPWIARLVAGAILFLVARRRRGSSRRSAASSRAATTTTGSSSARRARSSRIAMVGQLDSSRRGRTHAGRAGGLACAILWGVARSRAPRARRAPVRARRSRARRRRRVRPKRRCAPRTTRGSPRPQRGRAGARRPARLRSARLRTSSTLLDPAFARELEALRRRLRVRARSGGGGDHIAQAPRRRAPSSSSTARTHPATICAASTGSPSRARASRCSSSFAPRRTWSCASSSTRARRSTCGEPPKLARRQASSPQPSATWRSPSRARAGPRRERGPPSRLASPSRGRGALPKLLRELDRDRCPRRDGSRAQPIDAVVLRSPRPGMLVVVSDFLDAGPFDAAARRAAAAGHDLALVQVLWRPRRSTRPCDGDLALEDAETGAVVEVTIDARAVDAYLARLNALVVALLRASAKRHAATYVRVVDAASRCSRRCGASSPERSTDGWARVCSFSTPRACWLLAGARPARRPLHPQDQAPAAARAVDVAVGRRRSAICSPSTPSSKLVAGAARCSSQILALARPRPRARASGDARRAIDGDHVAIVIDTSASMAHARGGPPDASTRMDAARRRGRGRRLAARAGGRRHRHRGCARRAGRLAARPRPAAAAARRSRRWSPARSKATSPRRSRSRPIACARSAASGASSS